MWCGAVLGVFVVAGCCVVLCRVCVVVFGVGVDCVLLLCLVLVLLF